MHCRWRSRGKYLEKLEPLKIFGVCVIRKAEVAFPFSTRDLLRLGYRFIGKSIAENGNMEFDVETDHANRVNVALSDLALDDMLASGVEGQPWKWKDFLSYEMLCESSTIIAAANCSTDASHNDHSMQVISRAVLYCGLRLVVPNNCFAKLMTLRLWNFGGLAGR